MYFIGMDVTGSLKRDSPIVVIEKNSVTPIDTYANTYGVAHPIFQSYQFSTR